MATATVVAVAMAGAAVFAAAAPAQAAGETTHAWMAHDAIALVQNPQLKALLQANAGFVRAGAFWPDSGYYGSLTYGEVPHWQQYHDALIAQIRSRTDCGDLTAPTGPCAPLIAFMLGGVAHGMGDEVWDWLFEPNVADLGEYYTPADLGSFVSEGGAELQLDIAAIAKYGQPTNPIGAFPDHADLLAAFASSGHSGLATASDLVEGEKASNAVSAVEGLWAPTHIADMQKAMPWSANNVVTAPGGVQFAAKAIAAEWDNAWLMLLGTPGPTSVSITYPAPDQRRIPASGWVRSHYPGSARGNGGARTRIAAVLDYSRPYDGSPGGPVTDTLPVGSMSLTERDTGTAVPIEANWPRSVPYGPGLGEHMVDIQPAADLAPCTWYRASVTSALIDAHGQPVTPMSWDFRTGTDAEGNRCADDPYTADEAFARQLSVDLYARAATEPELQDVGYTFARGRTRTQYVDTSLGSLEARQALVAGAYQADLGRAPDPGGLAYWAEQLKTLKLADLHVRLLGSDEAYQRAGGTNRAFVESLYQLVLARAADPGGAGYWTGRLDAGLSRPKLARQLVQSPEVAARTVDQAYERFLGRAPDAGGAAYWTGVLEKGGDVVRLWRGFLVSAEYAQRAQSGG